MVVYKSDKIVFGTHFRSCLCWFVGRNMYYTISISICLAILSACAADKTEQAYSSISYHRHDVPLSYNFSQVHIYTKYPENTRMKQIKPHKYQIEQHTNTIDVEKKHENIQEDIPQENEHDDNERNTQSQHIHINLPSDILQNVETLEAVNHQAQEEHIKEHPEGFASQTQEHSTAAYNNIHFHGIPIQYYLNRATNLKSKAPEESINTNSLGHQNENVHYLQNNIRNQNVQHPSLQRQYDIPTVQLSDAYSHNIANVPHKAFTKIYNVERPQYYHERH